MEKPLNKNSFGNVIHYYRNLSSASGYYRLNYENISPDAPHIRLDKIIQGQNGLGFSNLNPK